MSEPFELPTELNIYSAMETHEALMGWAAEQTAKGVDALRVSAHQVQEVDGAGLQLVAALANTPPGWRLVHASTAFVEACTTLGLTAWLAHVTPYEEKAA